MSASLEIGCIIRKKKILDMLKKSKFFERHPDMDDGDMDAFLFEDVEEFLKKKKLPFKFYMPLTHGDSDDDDDHSKCYMGYVLSNIKLKQMHTKVLNLSH